MKVIAALSALLAAHSASADDMSFSMYGVKSGKGMTMGSSKSGKGGDMSFSMDMGKSGKGMGGKSGKGMDGKSGKKGAFDDCVFENPAIVQAFLYIPDLGVDERRKLAEFEESKPSGLRRFKNGSSSRELKDDHFDFEFIEHAYAANEIFSRYVKRYVNKGMSAEDIYDIGEEILNAHSPGIVDILEVAGCVAGCATVFAFIEQMEGTCNENKFMGAYVNVALSLLSGMYNGVYTLPDRRRLDGHQYPLSLNVLECTYYGLSDTVDEIWGKYITDEVRHLVDKGQVCDLDLAADADRDISWAFNEETAAAHIASLEEP